MAGPAAPHWDLNASQTYETNISSPTLHVGCVEMYLWVCRCNFVQSIKISNVFVAAQLSNYISMTLNRHLYHRLQKRHVPHVSSRPIHPRVPWMMVRCCHQDTTYSSVVVRSMKIVPSAVEPRCYYLGHFSVHLLLESVQSSMHYHTPAMPQAVPIEIRRAFQSKWNHERCRCKAMALQYRYSLVQALYPLHPSSCHRCSMWHHAVSSVA